MDYLTKMDVLNQNRIYTALFHREKKSLAHWVIHEMMRMSIKPGLGLKTEIIPKKIVEMRNEKHLWKNNKHVESIGDFYHKSSSITNEVGLLLFNGMVTFYRTLVKRCGYIEPPPVWISTHGIIENFFDKILKKNIFKKFPKLVNWNNIPKQSWNAYLT